LELAVWDFCLGLFVLMRRMLMIFATPSIAVTSEP
jgi:hypothetical protein